jgi:hypothetical protein
VDDSGPAPTSFTALNFATYAVAIERPLIVIGDVESAGESAVHEPYELPPFVDIAYS